MTPNWRHWYLSSALELEGRFENLPFKGNSLAVRDIWMAVDPLQLLRNLAVRLQAERCLDMHTCLRLDFTDRPLSVALGWPDLAAQLASGEVQLSEGSAEELQTFIACFEKPGERMPPLAGR